MLTGPTVILILKTAVASVTVLLFASLVVLWQGKRKLHGRINLAFFVLTSLTLVIFEVLIRFINPALFVYFEENPDLRRKLFIHLCFAVPSALLMPVMLFTGLTGRRRLHLMLAWVFGVLWIGTFVTGIFYLPHVP